MALNKVMLIGNVGADPEIRYIEKAQGSQENPKVATVRLATTEKYKDRSGALKEATEWHNLVVWGRNADLCEKYVRKGMQIYVEGSIHSREYETQQGVKKNVTDIKVSVIQLLGRKEDGQRGEGQQTQYRPQAAPAPAPAPVPEITDDLPF